MSNAKDTSKAETTTATSTAPVKRKPGRPPKLKFGAKADFIRSMPSSMSANQIVDEAAKQGIRLTVNHVYNIRAYKKAKGQAKVAPRETARAKHLTPTTPMSVHDAVDRTIALERSTAVIYSAFPKPSADPAAEALTKLIDQRIRAFFLSIAGGGLGR